MRVLCLCCMSLYTDNSILGPYRAFTQLYRQFRMARLILTDNFCQVKLAAPSVKVMSQWSNGSFYLE